ncbi:MAG: hypothetical protein ABDH32_07825, partial [Candidatus Caldarchaeales archaeon]
MTLFKELSELCERLREISGRNDKISLVVRFLRRLEGAEISWASRLLIGRTLPTTMSEELNVSHGTLMDLESVHSTLTIEPLTIKEVGETLLRIAKTSGYGSMERKKNMLRGLLGRMTDLERRWFMKMIIGEMQHGVNEGLLLEALSETSGTPIESIHRAYMLTGDIGELAQVAIEGGRDRIESIKLEVYRPVMPMLAEDCKDVDELFKDYAGEYRAEYKVDGARVQVHYAEEGVRIFSRRMNEITQSIPDIVEQ